LSKSQDDEIGDGTTSVVVLAGALLEHAEVVRSPFDRATTNSMLRASGIVGQRHSPNSNLDGTSA
jgi:hypothetical protein